MKVRPSRRAAGELVDILSYLSYVAAENAADRVAMAVERTLDWIGRWPRVSPVAHGRDIRSKLVVGFGLRVFYGIGTDAVLVRNIRSTRWLRPWEPAL